jgi:hypothetical protein
VLFNAANSDIIDVNGTSVSVGAFTIGANAQTFDNSGAAATITCTSLTMGAHNGDDYNHIFWPNVDINGTFVQPVKTGGLTFRGSLEVDTLTGHGANYITTYGPFTINDPNPITVTPNTAITGWGGPQVYNLYNVLNCAGMTLTGGSGMRAYAANSLGGITGPLNVSTNSLLILDAAQTTLPSGNIEIGPYALLGGDTGTATWGPGNNINALTNAVLVISAGTVPTISEIGADAVWKAHTSVTTTTAGANGTTIYKGISIGNYGYPSVFALNNSILVAPAGAGDVEVLVLPGLNHNNNNSCSIESVDQTGVANIHCRGTWVSKGFRINQTPNANSCTTFNFIGDSGSSKGAIGNFYYSPWNVYSSQTYNFSGAGTVFGEVKNIEGQLTFSDETTFDPQQQQSKTVTRYDGTKLTFNDGAALLIDTDDSNLLESLDADQVVVNGTPYLVLGSYAGAYNITAAANPRLYDFMTKSHVCIAENNNNNQYLRGDGIVLGDGRYLLSANAKGTKTLYSDAGYDARIRGVGGAGTSMGIACETGKTLVLNIPIDGNGAALKLNNDTEMTLIGGNLGGYFEGRRAPQVPKGTITLNGPIANVPSLTVLNGNVNFNAGVSVPPTMDLMVASGATATVNTAVTVDVVGGNGTVSGAANLTFDTVAPGASVGSLNLGSFTMPVDATYECEIGGNGGGTPVAGTDHDVINATAVTIDGTWNLHLVNTGIAAGGLTGSEVFTIVNGNSVTDFVDTNVSITASGFDVTGAVIAESGGDITITGLLVSGGATNPYDTWAAQIPDTNQRGRGDDPDGDGFSNGEEFLFGSSPVAGNGSLVTTTTSGGNLTLRWLQRESGATYTLQQSATLAALSWTTAAQSPALDGDQTGAPADYDYYSVTIPVGSGKLFYRIMGVEN